jgi:transcriptional regulator with XRE-family HTH domain
MKRAADDSGIIELVARNIRAARKAARLSQEELAHEARVDRTYISQVERRLRNVTISVLARIAKALGTTPDKLLAASTSSAPKRARTARK